MLLRLVLLLVLGGLSAHATPSHAAEPPTVIILFDGSGSMWGKLDGERSSKLVMAREAVRQGLTRLSPATRIGLMSFGHRRGGDCQDVEMLVEPTPVDIERIMTPIERLNPKGRGPFTRALHEAAVKLGPSTAPASVILIHDGADNCQQDPCSAIPVLKAAHPHVRVDVVSVGTSPEEAQSVACLPQATGGRQYRVASTAEIEQAMRDALGRTTAPAAADPPPSPKPAPAAPSSVSGPAGGRPGLQLWTSLVKGGPALSVPVHWVVRKAGDKGPPLWEGLTAAPLLVLPTGRYDVEARAGLITRTATAEAVEGSARALGLVLDAGALTLASTVSVQRMLAGSIVTLARIETKGLADPQILRHAGAEVAVAPGNYLVAVTDGALRIERPVGIAAGERVSIAEALNLGALELSAVAAKDGPPLRDLVYAIFEDDPDAPQGRREVARTAAPAPRLKLPAGTYYVVARHGLAEVRERVSVHTGETEKRVLVLETGRISVAVRVAGGRLESDSPIMHRIERLDAQPREVQTAIGPTTDLDVAAGQYRVEVRAGQGNVRASRELRLRPGEAERALSRPPTASRSPMSASRFATVSASSCGQVSASSRRRC